jgi:hypothetical protein
LGVKPWQGCLRQKIRSHRSWSWSGGVLHKYVKNHSRKGVRFAVRIRVRVAVRSRVRVRVRVVVRVKDCSKLGCESSFCCKLLTRSLALLLLLGSFTLILLGASHGNVTERGKDGMWRMEKREKRDNRGN